jgi:hypothetical protein
MQWTWSKWWCSFIVLCSVSCVGCHHVSDMRIKLVREDKKVPVTCWGCETEEVIVPRPACLQCEYCETVCVTDDPTAPCHEQRDVVLREWEPGCEPDIYERKKLMKKVETKTVPSYKWVVEDCSPKQPTTGSK